MTRRRDDVHHGTRDGRPRRAGTRPGDDRDLATATVVLTTTPAPRLHLEDGVRLRRLVHAAQRRLLEAPAPFAARRRAVNGLRHLADQTDGLSVCEGLALVAGPGRTELLHLRRSGHERVVVGPPPPDVLAQPWDGPTVAVLVVGRDAARLLLAGEGRLLEVTDRFPYRASTALPRARTLLDVLRAVDEALARALPAGVPVVVAGTEAVTGALRERSAIRERIAAVVPGDHTRSTPAVLHALARRLVPGYGEPWGGGDDAGLGAAERRGGWGDAGGWMAPGRPPSPFP